MRVVGYLRVSTDRQAESGYGLDVQRAAIRGWCRAGGHRLIGFTVDDGVSGAADPAERLGLAQAISELVTGRATAIVVYKLDRLARDLVMQEQLLAEVRRAGGRLHSCAAGEDAFLEDDPHDPTRALIRHVLGAVSQYERSMIRLRMSAGKTRKAAAGGYAGGRPPYGWVAMGRELVPDPAEQKVIREIRRRWRRGESLRTIAAALGTTGRERRVGAWRTEQLRQVLIRAGDLIESEHAQRRRAPR